MKHLWILGLLLMAACSGGTDDGPVACSPADRSGTYLFTYTETSGTCGPIPEQLDRLDDASSIYEGCTLDAPDHWTEADCKLERAFSCPEDGVGPGYTSSLIAVTEQRDDDASRVTGIMTITLYEPSGGVACKSTYTITATRQ